MRLVDKKQPNAIEADRVGLSNPTYPSAKIIVQKG